MPASIQADISQDISNSTENYIAKNTAVFNSGDASLIEDKQDSTALLFGIWGLLTKLSLALAIGIAFPLLDMVGLKLGASASAEPSQMAVVTLVMLYALIPIILKVWVIFKMWQFPYGRSYFTSKSSTQISEDTSTQTLAKKENIKVGKYDENTNSEIITHPVPFVTHHERM